LPVAPSNIAVYSTLGVSIGSDVTTTKRVIAAQNGQ
jgi:hypothetical protein